MEPFNWTCPHCSRSTTITNERVAASNLHLTIPNADGNKYVCSQFIVCPNPDCQKFTLEVRLLSEGTEVTRAMGNVVGKQPCQGGVEQSWRLVPPSRAKVFPSYIPQAIRDDYTEACLISELSPKASATLARRCLQGMIRDYWKVKPARLVDEINDIQSNVDPLTWDAIDSVRKVGNIGAHMEKNINLIIEVDPNEAELLLNLIETLINDWYIAREHRKLQLNQIKGIASVKDQAKKNKKTP